MNKLYAESHIRNLILMAKSDNHMDDRELAVILKIGQEKGFSKDEIEYFIQDDSNFDLIQPTEIIECFEQLYDLGLVMIADGIIEDDEIDFCTDFAEKLGLSSKEANMITFSIAEGLENNFSKYTIYETTKKLLQEIGE